MKRLAILRHAKSSWAEAGQDDFDRPLNGRGQAAARRMGEELTALGMAFDLVLASPAKRVCETLDGIGETFGTLPVRFDQSIYLASERTLLELVRATPDEVGSLLVVGHNPGLQSLVADLARDDDTGRWGQAVAKFPTCALAVLELPVENWSETERGAATISALILPRELD